MHIDVQSGAPLEKAAPCLIVTVFQDEALAGPAAALDEKLDGLVRSVMEEDGFKGTPGDTRVLYTQERIAAPRVILLGLGKRDAISADKLRKAAARAARGVRAIKRDAFTFAVPSLDNVAPTEAALALAEGIVLGLHVFHDFKTDDDTKNQTTVQSATLLIEDEANVAASRAGVQLGQIMCAANLRARALVNRPSNLKSPQYLAEQAQQIAAENGLRCEVWEEARIQEEHMGALWAVGMGSDNPPRFIVLEYSPPGKEQDAPFILVGKGMTYDTGGYSLKPTTSMEDMKDDMAGAAVVLGAMSAVQELGIERRVLGIVASAENMVSGHSMRPGDIITARNGKTIEVLNTDAEGRLILADALTYASEQNPAAIIDFATLTGAIGIALGQEAAGVFANDDAFSARVQAAGEAVSERVWPFPMWDEYRDHVKTPNADIKNMGMERRAGSIAGAMFLEHFVPKNTPWVHMDIAAVALLREDRPLVARGATGFGVRLVLELLRGDSGT